MFKATTDRELIISRVIHAPQSKVWEAWTNPRIIVKWFGPDGFTAKTLAMDVKPGGGWKYVMRGPAGQKYTNTLTYTKIVKPERLAYNHSGSGNLAPFHVTAMFNDQGKKTEVVMHMVFASAAELAKQEQIGAVAGGQQTLARLAKILE